MKPDPIEPTDAFHDVRWGLTATMLALQHHGLNPSRVAVELPPEEFKMMVNLATGAALTRSQANAALITGVIDFGRVVQIRRS